MVLFIFLPINAIAPYGYIIVDERGKERTLNVGENWEMGEGFILTVDTMEKSAKFTLSKDGKILERLQNTKEILIDDNMYYEGNIDGIDYVFQTTLRAVERNSAVLADTELYAPNVVPEDQRNYLTIIVSIFLIVAIPVVFFLLRRRTGKSREEQKIEKWEKEGYDVSELKEALERKK